MTKQINKRRQSLLLTMLAIVITLSASSVVSAQKSFNAKFPKPDFKAMEEYFEIVDYEYDFTSGISQFSVVAKKTQQKVPRYWTITWRDDKGVKVTSFTLMFESYNIKDAKVGEPIRCSSYAPEEKDIPRIKSVVVTEFEGDKHWTGSIIRSNNRLPVSFLDLNWYAENAQTER